MWSAKKQPRSTITMKERADDVSPAQVEADGKRLFRWLEENGGFVGKIKVTLVDKGKQKIRGLIATAPLATNETIFRVPRHLFLCSDDVAWPSYQSQSTSLFPSPRSDYLLAIRIWEEEQKGEESRWATFLKELPGAEEFATFHPMMASDALLRPFEALPIVKMINLRKKKAHKWFQVNSLGNRLRWEDFWLGYVRYISRSYGITVKTKTGKRKWMPVAVPVADLGNTAATQDQVNTRWAYDDEREEFVVTVTMPVAEGQELFESYQISSLKDNSKLAYMFGFTLPGNPTHVEQLSSEVCRSMLQLPEEVMGRSRVSSLLYSLAQEHCVASGETEKA